MSDQLILGFGDGTLDGVVRSDGGALVCRAGHTARSERPRVHSLDGSAGWRATTEDGLDVVLEPLGDPARFPDGTREWLCRAQGKLNAAPIDCLGHAVLQTASPRGVKRVALTRGVAAWLAEDLAVTLRARRPTRAKDHEGEEVAGFLLGARPAEPRAIADPRLSTAYAADGSQRRAGLELWETAESDYPLRLAGEAIGEGELELAGGMRLRSAFFLWRYAGRVGAGRYDILRGVA